MANPNSTPKATTKPNEKSTAVKRVAVSTTPDTTAGVTTGRAAGLDVKSAGIVHELVKHNLGDDPDSFLEYEAANTGKVY